MSGKLKSEHDPASQPIRPGRPTPEQAARIGDAVLEAARGLFITLGYERTSMDQVAARAGVSKRTIYNRHGSKADLFHEVARQLGHRTLTALEAFDPAPGPPSQVLHALAKQLLVFAGDPDTVAMERMTMEMSQQFPELMTLREDQSRRTRAVVVRQLARIGDARDLSPEQLDRDAMIFLSMTLVPTLHRAMMHGDTRTFGSERYLSRAIAVFLEGHRSAGPTRS